MKKTRNQNPVGSTTRPVCGASDSAGAAAPCAAAAPLAAGVGYAITKVWEALWK